MVILTAKARNTPQPKASEVLQVVQVYGNVIRPRKVCLYYKSDEVLRLTKSGLGVRIR